MKMYKVIGVLFFLCLTSCQNKVKNKQIIPRFYQDLDVILIANKKEIYSCYRNYIKDERQPENGDVYIQWKLFGKTARDIYISKSFSEGINVCLITVLRNIEFNDLYLEGEVRIARYIFAFLDGELRFKVQSDERSESSNVRK